MRAFLIIATLLLTSCTSTQGLSVFSFNSTDIESLLTNELPKLNDKLSVIGVPVEFVVDKLNVNIGPENKDVVVLNLDSSANIKAFLINYPVRLRLQVEGSPYYDSKQKAVFLRNVALLDSSVDAGGFTGNLNLLNNQAMAVVNRFLDVNPVYKLDTSDPQVALLSSLPLDLKVVQGSIKIVPILGN